MRLGTLFSALLVLGAFCGTSLAADLCEEYGKNKEFDKQIEACTKNIEAGTDLYMSYDRRGSAYFEKGDNEKAAEDFAKAIGLEPRRKEAYLHRAHAYKKMEQLGNSILDFTKAIRLDPSDASLFFERSLAYQSRGQYGDMERADDDCGTAIRLDRKYKRLCVEQGYIGN